jgi:hypothetical protein
VGRRGGQPAGRHRHLPAQRREPGSRRAGARGSRPAGDLGGAITADRRQLIDRAPGDDKFTIPDCSDPRAMATYALQRLNTSIAAYQAFPADPCRRAGGYGNWHLAH